MIIAGSFGHGTVAGTRYATSPAFLALPTSEARHAFECLVKTDVWYATRLSQSVWWSRGVFDQRRYTWNLTLRCS